MADAVQAVAPSGQGQEILKEDGRTAENTEFGHGQEDVDMAGIDKVYQFVLRNKSCHRKT